jgi:UDP-N-acetylglucosamine acyltransferase
MSATIAPTAIVDPRAIIEDDVRIGHFCVVGPDVTLGRGTQLENHVTILGRVTVGEDNHFHSNSVIGGAPQDKSFRGSDTCVEIGHFNTFREGVTINLATEKEDGITRVGNQCFIMANSHIAHDCKVGDRVVLANNAMLGGHVHVHNDATVSGGVGVHQFSSIGSFAFVSAVSRVISDIPPYMLCEGLPARPRCVNIVALKRNNFPAEDIKLISEAFKLLYRSKVGVESARELLLARGPVRPCIKALLDFLDHQCGGSHGRGRDRRKKAA